MTTIDIHCHLATPASRSPVEAHRKPEHEPYDFYMGQDSRDHNKVMYPGIVEQLTNPAARLQDMDRMGVDVQGLATFVSEYHYWAPADLGRGVGPNPERQRGVCRGREPGSVRGARRHRPPSGCGPGHW